MLVYFLKMILIQAIGLGIYYAFLRNEKLFAYSRIFLWTCVFFSFVIPLISVPIFESSGLLQTVNNASDEIVITLPTFIVNASATSSISWPLVLVIFIAIVSLVQLIRLFISYQKIRSIEKGAEVLRANVYLSDAIELPFSFMNKVYVPKRFENIEALPIIIAHEEAHILHKHSIDKIVISVLSRLFWFNPLLVLFHKELELIHEYEVDASVAQAFSLDHYLDSFLQSAMLIQSNPICLTHSFFSSPIKNRIIMLYKKSKNKLRNKSFSILTLTLVLSGMLFFQCHGQTTGSANNIEIIEFGKDTVYVENTDGSLSMQVIEKNPLNVYKKVDKSPEYPGGDIRLMEYLNKNIKYPKNAKDKKIQGTIYIEFIVDDRGYIVNPEIKKSIAQGEELEREALRVVRRMLTWVPARHQGKDVASRLILPIQFKL